MTEPFDAYHKWLGIAPSQQPPTHYRLLGIEAFESDPDVIEAAANQRMAYLQTFTSGPQVQEAQQLLNEIAAARRCLLNQQSKAEYDSSLRSSDSAAGTGSFEFLDPNESEPKTQVRSSNASKSTVRTWAISTVVLVAGLAVVAAVFLRPDSEDGVAGEGEATLVVDWPLDEREGASVEIGGKKQALPDQRRVEFRVPLGRQEVVFTRDGYREIRRGIRFTKEPVKLRLNWRPVASQ